MKAKLIKSLCINGETISPGADRATIVDLSDDEFKRLAGMGKVTSPSSDELLIDLHHNGPSAAEKDSAEKDSAEKDSAEKDSAEKDSAEKDSAAKAAAAEKAAAADKPPATKKSATADSEL
jgi:hypothetical protein